MPPLSVETPDLPDEEIAAYRESFNLFDRDGNGTISPQEIGAVMRDLGQDPTQAQIDDIVKSIDVNGDGNIDFEEFLKLMRAMSMADEDAKEQIWEAFKVFDMDGNGTISIDELKLVMQRLGEKLTDHELRKMISEADSDGDGEINYNEFCQMILGS